MGTSYHVKYFAHDLARQSAESGVERLASSLFNASIELTPHQIDAALFALRSPLAAGALLADEVGLGKTIEAGLVLCQCWAERKRRLLVLCPASLRTQWQDELLTKFNLPSRIVDAFAYRQAAKDGQGIPFQCDEVVISSFNFAAAKHEDLLKVTWDLIVFDEAHKLRNCYRESNVMGQRLLSATRGFRKLLLTATPLQNSLLELFGIGQLLDEYIFGDKTAFQQAFMNGGGDPDALRNRLASFCKRTLRKDVQEYVPFTERHALLESFAPNADEQNLYERMSAYLQREDTYAIPKRLQHLQVLGGRKRLASSTAAIVGTLDALIARLKRMAQGLPAPTDDLERLVEELIDDEALDDDEAEELLVADSSQGTSHSAEIDRLKLNAEIAELEELARLARSIRVDSKAKALLKGLEKGFQQMQKVGAQRKALIFTESRRTQDYLKNFLEQNGYLGQVALFNGSNSTPEARAAYDAYLQAQRGAGKPLTSREVDTRAALVEDFRNQREIMIATEAGAEGINLQFCSLVVNYDMPWNPQRVEQRIGRCHRYGQKHDVVVLNFLNSKNLADKRVYELLEAKFRLFNGIFGSSDEVLGSLESGVDFERRILAIYQKCRTPQEIEAAFAELRSGLDEQINERMQKTRDQLLAHFDEEVHERLKVQLDDARQLIGKMERRFWIVTRHALAQRAEFQDEALCFKLHDPPMPPAKSPPGLYRLISKLDQKPEDGVVYRLNHPLGEWAVEQGKQAASPPAEITFHVTQNPTRIAVVEQLKGKGGWLRLDLLTLKGAPREGAQRPSAYREDHLLFTGTDDSGAALPNDVLSRLFDCQRAEVRPVSEVPDDVEQRLAKEAEQHAAGTIDESSNRSLKFMHERFDMVDRWADDQEKGLERRIDQKKSELRQAFANSNKAKNLAEKEQFESEKEKLRRELQKLRRQREEAFDAIMEKSEQIKSKLRDAVKQTTDRSHLFTIRWQVR